MIYRRTKKLSDGRTVEYPHYWYQFKRDGVAVRINTKQSNRRTAEELEAAHRTRLAKGEAGLRNPRDVPTLKHFKERFEKATETTSPKTKKFYSGMLKALLRFPHMAEARLNRIDEALIQNYVEWRGENVSRSTVNRELATLRKALRLAQEWRVIDRVPRIRLLPANESETSCSTERRSHLTWMRVPNH
jgi:hypothetical protein